MDAAIAIPTKDRSENLRTVLAELTEQERQYGHNIPIHVFDHSRSDSARAVVEEFDNGIPVRYHGSMERKALIDRVTKGLHCNPQLIEPIFSRGYGGNRNFILGTLSGQRIICLDDDIIPVRLDPTQGHNGFQKELPFCDPGEIHVTTVLEVPEEETTQTRYDFLTAMLERLGAKVGEVKAPHAEEGQSIVLDQWGDQRMETGTKIVIEREKRIGAVFPRIAYHPDYAEAWMFREGIASVTPYAREVIMADGTCCPIGCHAMDTSMADVPFLPTTLRCEDGPFLNYNASRGNLAYLVRTENVVHKRGPRSEDTANANEESILTQAFGAILEIAGREHEYDISKVGKSLIDLDFDTSRAFLNVTIKEYEENGVGFLRVQKEDVAILHARLHYEVILAGATFYAWKPTREFLKTIR